MLKKIGRVFVEQDQDDAAVMLFAGANYCGSFTTKEFSAIKQDFKNLAAWG